MRRSEYHWVISKIACSECGDATGKPANRQSGYCSGRENSVLVPIGMAKEARAVELPALLT